GYPHTTPKCIHVIVCLRPNLLNSTLPTRFPQGIRGTVSTPLRAPPHQPAGSLPTSARGDWDEALDAVHGRCRTPCELRCAWTSISRIPRATQSLCSAKCPHGNESSAVRSQSLGQTRAPLAHHLVSLRNDLRTRLRLQ